MIIYPAIDLKGGQCVRLKRGSASEVTVYNEDPVEQARQFESLGYSWLHIVDLDGAFTGKPANSEQVERILAATRLKVQLGGGIRNISNVEHWLDRGVSRVILGTVALKDPVVVEESCRLFPGQIAVGIDARQGIVAVEGWTEGSNVQAVELAKKFESVGVAVIIYTDISRDGMMEGVNIAETVRLAESIKIPVIASGGVSSLDDICKVKACESSGITGVIVGRAIYEGMIDHKEALRVVQDTSQKALAGDA
jgi:phosphoribosylformimino-5-aminoimidazole carboxamide ribotide isomerase